MTNGYSLLIGIPEEGSRLHRREDNIKIDLQEILYEGVGWIQEEVMGFWVVSPCNVQVEHERFGRPCSLHLQG